MFDDSLNTAWYFCFMNSLISVALLCDVKNHLFCLEFVPLDFSDRFYCLSVSSGEFQCQFFLVNTNGNLAEFDLLLQQIFYCCH